MSARPDCARIPPALRGLYGEGGGLPALYAVLTAGAASALTRAPGADHTVLGMLLGPVSAVGIQLIGCAFGPFAAWEFVEYPLLGVTAGCLGVAAQPGRPGGGVVSLAGERCALTSPSGRRRRRRLRTRGSSKEARRAGMIGERKRLAREIHDTLIQGFASIVVNLGKPPRARSGRSRTPYAHHLEAGRDARDGLSEARRIVWALRPGALDGAPLPDALSRLAERWSKATGVAADVAVTGRPCRSRPRPRRRCSGWPRRR